MMPGSVPVLNKISIADKCLNMLQKGCERVISTLPKDYFDQYSLQEALIVTLPFTVPKYIDHYPIHFDEPRFCVLWIDEKSCKCTTMSVAEKESILPSQISTNTNQACLGLESSSIFALPLF